LQTIFTEENKYMRTTIIGLLAVLLIGSLVLAEEKVAIKPPSPRLVGPPPLPFEGDVLRYVFQHFPDVDKEKAMSFIGEHFKAELPAFRKLANENASHATVFMMDLVSEALVLMDIAEKDPELASMMIRQRDIERKALRKAKEVALADDDEKAKLKAELKKMLEQTFDAKQKLMMRDLAGMQAELKKLDTMIQKRSEYRQQIIDKKLTELTVEENYLKW
jgi:hypothetical protein